MRRSLGRALLKEARPKHWVKNGFLFAGIVFAKKLTNVSAIWHVLGAFRPLLHRRQCDLFHQRSAGPRCGPTAPKEALSPHRGGRNRGAARVDASRSIGLAWRVPLSFLLRPMFGVIVVAYVALQFAYTYWLKEQVLLDVFALAASFVLRAMAGAVVIAAPISPWLYVCTVLLSLCLGFAKRRHELMLLEAGAGSHRPVLDEYSATLLEEIIAVVTSATVMAYALYTFNAENLPRNHAMMFTIPFVLYAVFRYLYLVYRKGEGGNPEEALFSDRPLLICILLWGITSVVILYACSD